jgi:hypothetical protein
MRVTFPRLEDHEIAYALVERDDGVVYRMPSDRAGTALPHDIRHLIVERELGVTDGLWGGIAAGAVLKSMRLLRAELLADLVQSVAALDDPAPDEIRRLTAAKLAVLRETAPSPESLATAACALQVEAARWARLRPGEQLRYEWPSPPVAVTRQARRRGPS